jgi:hypothetical protein
MALLIFGLTLIIMMLVSLAHPTPSRRPAARFHWSDLKPETTLSQGPWYRDYRTQAAALVVLMVAFIVAFW